MAIIGYARISTQYQQFDSQLEALTRYGCDTIYQEVKSGRQESRTLLTKILTELKPGDTLVVFKLDRLSRGTKHLLILMEDFNCRGIHFVSIQNNIDTSTSTGRFFFTIMCAFAEMEADVISERVISGLIAAKQKGTQLGRPPLNQKMDMVIDLYLTTNLSITKIALRAEISRPTVYRYLNKMQIPLRRDQSKE